MRYNTPSKRGVFMNVPFRLFLTKVKYTKDMDDIVSYIKENPDLKRSKVNQLLGILKKENATFHMLEVSKYARNLGPMNMRIIGCAIAQSSSSLEIYEFLKAHADIPDLHNLLIKRLCALKNTDILRNLVIEFPGILKEHRSTVMSIIIRESFISYLLEFATSTKEYLKEYEIKNIVDRVVEEKKVRYISQAIEIFPKNERLIQTVLDSNDAKYIYETFKTNYEKWKKYHKRFIYTLCVLHNPEVLMQFYTEMNEMVNRYNISSPLLRLIIKKGKLKDIFIFIERHKEVITKPVLDEILDRVCKEKDPFYICLMSLKFPNFKTEKLVHAFPLTSNAKFLFCFLKYNPSLRPEFVQAILFILIQSNDIKYIYKCLNECQNLQPTHRNQLLGKLLETIKDPKIREVIDQYSLLDGKGFVTVSNYYSKKLNNSRIEEIRQYTKSA